MRREAAWLVEVGRAREQQHVVAARVTEPLQLAVQVFEVDDLYVRLTSLGYHGHKQPWDAFWGRRYAIVHDPDGNGVSLFSPTAEPKSRAPGS